MIPLGRLALINKLGDPHDRIYDVDALVERRCHAENKCLSYQRDQQCLQEESKTLKPMCWRPKSKKSRILPEKSESL